MLVVEYEQLQQYFGGSSPGQVIAKLEAAEVRYLTGRNGRPFTTLNALNYAMGLPAGDFSVNTEKHPETRPSIKVL